MDVEGVLDDHARLRGHGRKVVATVQELKMQISGSIPREVRGKGREEVLFGIRCDGCGEIGLNRKRATPLS
jgi:hypothetical protein